MGQISEAVMIGQVVDRLVAVHPELPPDDVAGVVHSAYQRFQASKVREFVPLLVERRARAELTSRASSLIWST
ncbi:three-helix bundle dimerization domain-containing protein [Mycolicibacterium sp. CBM1]